MIVDLKVSFRANPVPSPQAQPQTKAIAVHIPKVVELKNPLHEIGTPMIPGTSLLLWSRKGDATLDRILSPEVANPSKKTMWSNLNKVNEIYTKNEKALSDFIFNKAPGYFTLSFGKNEEYCGLGLMSEHQFGFVQFPSAQLKEMGITERTKSGNSNFQYVIVSYKPSANPKDIVNATISGPDEAKYFSPKYQKATAAVGVAAVVEAALEVAAWTLAVAEGEAAVGAMAMAGAGVAGAGLLPDSPTLDVTATNTKGASLEKLLHIRQTALLR